MAMTSKIRLLRSFILAIQSWKIVPPSKNELEIAERNIQGKLDEEILTTGMNSIAEAVK